MQPNGTPPLAQTSSQPVKAHSRGDLTKPHGQGVLVSTHRSVPNRDDVTISEASPSSRSLGLDHPEQISYNKVRDDQPLEGGYALKMYKVLPFCALTLVLVAGCGTSASAPTHAHNTKTKVADAAPHVLSWRSAPPMTINPKDNYQAVVHTTVGNFTMQLFASQDPVAVNNFVFLSTQHFYDGDKFFRVLPSFVIQTGDPYNDGTGGPGYTWAGEFPVPFPYQPGIVAMAVSGTNPNSNGSQFFICTGPESVHLNQEPIYTELGRITKGWSTIDAIERGPVTVNPVTNEKSYPIHPASITSITINVSPPSS